MTGLLVAVLALLPILDDPRTSSAPQTFFDDVVGEWRGEGELFGQPTEFRMTWTHQLQGRFARLEYSILGARGMDAVGHYRVGDTELTGTWVDSRGEILGLSGEVASRSLEIIWRSPTETGRTTYELLESGELAAVDYVQAGDGWRMFATAVYSRVAPSGN